MKHRGIALYITIGLITLISIVIMRSLDLINSGFQHVANVEKINQTKVVVTDIEKVMAVIFGEIKSSEDLQYFIGVSPPVVDKDGRFMVSLETKPFHRGVNINKLLEEANSSAPEPDKVFQLKEKYESLFNYIFSTYRIKDGELLLNMILDVLDTDFVERSIDSEIAIKDPTFPNGIIPNKEAFNRIIAEYRELSDDNEIQKVPWDDFFIFTIFTSELSIDCTFMSENLAEALKLEVSDVVDSENDQNNKQNFRKNSNDENGEKKKDQFGQDDKSEEIGCESISDKKNDDIKKEFNIKEFDNNSTYYLEGVVSYSANIIEEGFKFIYDLKSKRIVDLEIVQ